MASISIENAHGKYTVLKKHMAKQSFVPLPMISSPIASYTGYVASGNVCA